MFRLSLSLSCEFKVVFKNTENDRLPLYKTGFTVIVIQNNFEKTMKVKKVVT